MQKGAERYIFSPLLQCACVCVCVCICVCVCGVCEAQGECRQPCHGATTGPLKAQKRFQKDSEVRWHQWHRTCLPTQGTHVPPLGREDSLEKKMATHCSILACRISWTRGTWSPTAYKVTKSRKRLNMRTQTRTQTRTHARRRTRRHARN